MACSTFRPRRDVGPLASWCEICRKHISEHVGASRGPGPGRGGTGGGRGGGGDDDDDPSPDPSPPRRRGSGGGRRPRSTGGDEDEAKQIWLRLGGEEDGKGEITLAAIVHHSRYLESTFPDLVTKYAEIADKGKIKWDAFLSLFKGKPEDEASHRTLDQRDIRNIFNALDEDRAGKITLENVIARKDEVQSKIPELVSQWDQIDVDGSHTISWEEFKAFFGGTDEWLEFQLSEVVGLDSLKEQIRRFHRSVALDAARRERGHAVDSGGGRYHMIFQGNPGTGKTSLGRIVAKLLFRAGISKSDQLREVQREQLVGEYVGQTSGKTQAEINKVIGGVLFIDEAYRLSQGGEKDFGKEAIEQLMASMLEPVDKAPIMVFAGYPADMERFMTQNDGLYSRIPYTFDFPDYTCSDLAEILELMVNRKGYEIEQSLLERGRARLAAIIERNTLPRAREMMNGRLCDRIFGSAKQCLDARDDHRNPTVVLNNDDITTACQQIPPPPEPSGGADAAGAADPDEVRRLRRQVSQLQTQVSTLQQEKAELQRQLADSGGGGGGGGGRSSVGRGAASPSSRAGRGRPGPAAPAEGSATMSNVTFQIKFRDWTDFEAEQQEQLNEARRNGDTTCVISARGRDFEVDLVDMVQRSVGGGGRDREIRIIGGEEGSDEATLNRIFRALDRNNDGGISRLEMSRVLQELDPDTFTDDAVDTLFAEADADNDRRVSPAELFAWLAAGGEHQEIIRETLGA